MLKKLFGGKKEFYVQLDENQTSTPVETPAPVAATVVEEAQKSSPSVQTDSKKTSIKKKSAKTSTPAENPEPVKVAPAPKAKLDPSQVAFASADPIPQNVARRNPGPSLNRFKAMARQVKTR